MNRPNPKHLFKSVLSSALAVIFLHSLSSALPAQCEEVSQYTPWGIDEYQLFGLTKRELSQQFKGKLFFYNDYKRATFSEAGTGLGYQGAVFKLTFKSGKVDTVHGVFEGCRTDYARPLFKNKEAAVRYAIDGLGKQSGAKEKRSLDRARTALAEIVKQKKNHKTNSRLPNKQLINFLSGNSNFYSGYDAF